MWQSLLFALILIEACGSSSERGHGDSNEALPVTLWWFAPFFSASGYGSEARDYVKALTHHTTPSVRMKITQHGDSVTESTLSSLPDDLHQLLNQLELTAANMEKTVVVCHSEPGAWNPPKYPTSLCPPLEEPLYTIGRTMFETDRIPVEWAHRAKMMDEVWVPSDFHVATFSKAGVPRAKLKVVPEGVDTEFYHPDGDAMALPVGRLATPSGCSTFDFKLKFLSVFKWEPRKGWKTLIRSFVRAFYGRCDVVLQILTDHYHSNENIPREVATEVSLISEAREECGHSDCTPPVFVLDTHIPDEDMPRLYRGADVFVLPSHGEGFGRPQVEAMACGIPVIATNWSGITAYLNENNGYPIRVDGLVPVGSGAFRHHKWAQPSEMHLKQLFLAIDTNEADRKRKGQLARSDIVDGFSLPTIARAVNEELWRIVNKLREEGELD